jgi:hypothetical protein
MGAVGLAGGDSISGESDQGVIQDCIALGKFLGDCVVPDRFRPRPEYGNHIRLSERGENVFRKVSQRNAQYPNLVRLAVFLKMFCNEGPLISEDTDVVGLAAVIDEDLKNQKLFLPYIYGRDLHDLWAEDVAEPKKMDARRSIELLGQTPIGVYQAGRFVSGPFGLLTSSVSRDLWPTRFIPGYLCSDPACPTVHKFELTTGENKNWTRIQSSCDGVLRSEYPTESAAMERLSRQLSLGLAGDFDKFKNSSALIDLLADAMSLVELQYVLDSLLRSKLGDRSYKTDLIKKVGFVGDPTKFVESLEQPALLQMLLLHSDSEIEQAVDVVIADGKIPFSETEVRGHKFQRRSSHVIAEMGHNGLRYRGQNLSGYATQRLLQILRRLYLNSSTRDPEDLVFQLQLSPSEHPDDNLRAAVHQFDVEELIRSSIASNRATAVETGKLLNISQLEQKPAEQIVSAVRWKIGLPAESQFDGLQKVATFGEDLKSALGAGEEKDVIRGHIANLFVELESALQSSISFLTWALTTDHYQSERRFAFDPIRDVSLSFIDTYAPTDDPLNQLHPEGRSTLVPLCASFSRLANALQSLDSENHIRPTERYPVLSQVSDQPFLWRHLIPFLDLTQISQEKILAHLREISSLLQQQSVIDLRNASQHGNRELPDAHQVNEGLSLIETARDVLEKQGIYPHLFTLHADSSDLMGRRTVTYVGGTEDFEILLPNGYAPSRMPHVAPAVLAIPSALTASVGILRFTLIGRPGPDLFWDGWPKRLRPPSLRIDGFQEPLEISEQAAAS